MMQRLSSLINPADIHYIISNHVEMDHSGSLPLLTRTAKNATIITSPHGQKGLLAHYKRNDWNFKVVKTDETIALGKKNIKFVLTPLIHWPDNMMSFLIEDGILFSNDAFGQHIASSERFDDEYPLGIIIDEAEKILCKYCFALFKPGSKGHGFSFSVKGRHDCPRSRDRLAFTCKDYSRRI